MLSCYQMGLIQTDIALNKPLWIRGPKVATRQPLQGEWFCRWWPRIIALCLSFLTDFLLVLLFTWVLVIVGSTGQYFQPIRVPPIVQLTHKWHHKKVCCVSHDFQVRRRDARRWGVTWEEGHRRPLTWQHNMRSIARTLQNDRAAHVYVCDQTEIIRWRWEVLRWSQFSQPRAL